MNLDQYLDIQIERQAREAGLSAEDYMKKVMEKADADNPSWPDIGLEKR